MIFSELRLALTYILGILFVILCNLFILFLIDVNYYYPDIPLDLFLLSVLSLGSFLNGVSSVLTNICTLLKLHKLITQIQLVQLVQLVPYILALLSADSIKTMVLIWSARNMFDLFCLCLILFRNHTKILRPNV